MEKEIRIVVPVARTRHPMLMDCVRNIRMTTGREPIVWECGGNVAVARNEALASLDPGWTIFVDTDAFPVQKDWDQALVKAAEKAGAVIANGREFFDFGDKLEPANPGTRIIGPPINCAGALLAVDTTKCGARFDENLGYSSGTLGPCIEDTDFARAVAEAGGKMIREPSIPFLHKDRGATDMKGFLATDEAFCYWIVGLLVSAKWALGMPGFFEGIGRVPADGRWLGKGVSPERLLEGYEPAIERMPADVARRFRRIVQREALSHFGDRLRKISISTKGEKTC